MPRISYSDKGNTWFQKLLGHNEDILLKWRKLEETFYSNGVLNKFSKK
jgi:hypothetical protein